MSVVECDSFMAESENRDEWITGDEMRELKYRRIESTYVDCDNVDSTLEALTREVEMGREELEKERKEVEELSQEVENLRKRLPEIPYFSDDDEEDPLPSFEIYEERTKQHRAFEKLLRDTPDIKYYSTFDDVKKMIKISEDQYPLLNASDRYHLITMRLYMLDLLEQERIMMEYRNEIYKKIVELDDLSKMKYGDFKYANSRIGSCFDDSCLETLFNCSIVPSIPFLMIPNGCTWEEAKESVLTSMEERYRRRCEKLQNYSVDVRGYED
ncbi:hypothetical protein QJS10_CPA16g00203 [Acorus calamus]|uniref:FF domain-containing protein n=1 Tax=Acorus calamus TaxID=4465 RepID=A0AAV9CYC6_ACOCL|nr:hypothetical protein QJS10_CPA16g00203 [Acorus calamus]